MASRHPQTKEELQKLQKIILEKLSENGTNNIAIRQIANDLNIDTGLVIKYKQQMLYRLSQKPEEKTTNIGIKEDKMKNNISKEDIIIQKSSDKNDEEIKNKKNKKFLNAKEQVEICNYYLNDELTATELAEMYDVVPSTIYRCLKSHGINKNNNKEKNMKRKKMSTTRSRNLPKETKEKDVKTTENNITDNKPFAVIKFVTDMPLYDWEKFKTTNIIWAISKNRERSDLRDSINIQNIMDMDILNDFRDKYNLVSISEDNTIHLIDYWNVTEQKIECYSQNEKIKIKNNDGTVITHNEFDIALKQIIDHDKVSKRSRLKIGEFCFDPQNFNNLHKIFGFDKFSFNVISKNNDETIEAGLVADRHEGIPVTKYIYDGSFNEELMFNYPEQERIAKKFMMENFDFSEDPSKKTEKKIKQLKLYVTGIQCAYGAVMKVCIDMGINLVTMHYNAKTKSYVPQYINGNPEDTGGYIKAFDRLKLQKSLTTDILLFNCTYKDFSESNVDEFYIMEASRMNDTKDTNNGKGESIIIIIKNRQDIWRIYPTILDHLLANDGLDLALWVTTASIKNNNLQWGMNIVKSFNYK